MKRLSPTTQGLLAINLAAILFGSAALYGKLNVSPFWIVGMRAVFACLALLAIGLARKEIHILNPAFIKPSFWPAFFMTGLLLSIHWVSFFLSVQMAGVAVATLTFATFPLVTVVFEALRYRRHLALIEITACIAIVFAVMLLVHVNPDQQNLYAGMACGLLSAATFAWFGISSKTLGVSLPNLTLSFYQNCVVALLVSPLLPFIQPMPMQVAQWLGLASLGIITTALMHQLYLFALQRLSAGTCSGFIALEPVYAIIFAAILFSEDLTFNIILSGGLIVCASFLLLRQGQKNT